MRPSTLAAPLLAFVLVAGVLPAATVARSGAEQPRAWYLTSPAEFRLPPPPAAGSATTRSEVAYLLRLQRERTPKIKSVIAKWNAQPSVVPWTQVALSMIEKYRPRPAPASRILAMLETGMYDAMVAADDSRRFYRSQTRPVPAVLDPRIKPVLKTSDSSSYASPEAAIAGAAEKILPYLFPLEPPQTFQRLGTEAVQSRLWAGLNYGTDVARARELGWKVAGLVIARGNTDGHTNTGFSSPRLTGDAYWVPTPPTYEPPIGGPVGTWKPWLLSSPDELRHLIPGPSPYGSPAFMAQLQQVLDVHAHLTENQKQIAHFWDDGPGTFTPPGHWFSIAIDLLGASNISAPQATEAFALLGVSEADSAIAFFEAKYHWWAIRPVTAIWRLCDGGNTLCTDADIQANPSRATYNGTWYPIIATPSFPSYPGGHGTFSGAAGKLLGYFFPSAADALNGLAVQAANSRLYGGIHYDEDNKAGLVLGRAVADLAIDWARSDGAFRG